MGRGTSRDVEWGIGLAFVLGMVILLVLAVSQFEGPTTVVMLVAAGVCFLVGVFLLSGTDRGAELAVAADHGAAKVAPPTGRMPQGTIRQGGGQVLVVCPGCGQRAAANDGQCANCGAKI